MKLEISPEASEHLQKSNYADILSVKDAQKILGVCRVSVYHLIESRQLNAFRIGRVYMIPKQAIAQFLMNRKGGEKQ